MIRLRDDTIIVEIRQYAVNSCSCTDTSRFNSIIVLAGIKQYYVICNLIQQRPSVVARCYHCNNNWTQRLLFRTSKLITVQIVVSRRSVYVLFAVRFRLNTNIVWTVIIIAGRVVQTETVCSTLNIIPYGFVIVRSTVYLLIICRVITVAHYSALKPNRNHLTRDNYSKVYKKK